MTQKIWIEAVQKQPVDELTYGIIIDGRVVAKAKSLEKAEELVEQVLAAKRQSMARLRTLAFFDAGQPTMSRQASGGHSMCRRPYSRGASLPSR